MKIIILGNGISGITAARFIRKLSDNEIVVISAETDYFFSRTALMYIYMGQMRFQDTQPYEPWFWEKNRIQLKRAYIQNINPTEKTVHTSEGEAIAYDKLIIATGSRSNKFGWPGQDLSNVHGLYSIQDLAAMETASKGLQRAVIVGGGLIGVEMAEMFHSRHIPVTFLVRENSFWNGVLPAEESAMVNRHLREHGIDLLLSTELEAIIDDGSGQVGAVLTKSGERIECGFVGLTAGVSPNIAFLENSGIETNRGILVDQFLQTNLPDIYAAGDCVEVRVPQPGRKAIEPVWYTGRIMGETLAYTVCGDPTPYDPGIWFNSAKFFDIEYQIYGQVPANMPDELATIYWEHPPGKKSIRLVYERTSRAVVGFNLMGIRFRQEVCEQWITAKTPIDQVVGDLKKANFDPEFYRRYEKEVSRIFQQSKMVAH
jgi:NADPH-dependent 2,4-dienoyl-CoA reductase/sulfur reductase-like enzyme